MFRASRGEFTRDCAGKGESSRAPLAQLIAEALWLCTKAEDECSKLVLGLFTLTEYRC